MSKNNIEQVISELYEKYAGSKPINIVKLPQSGSYREYFRITGVNETVIAAYNEDKAENEAFTEFTKHFYELGISVPKFLIENTEQNVYLLQDLGDTTLLSYLHQLNYPSEVVP